MPHDDNRTTEYKYTVEGQLAELIVRNSVTGDQVTRWHYGTTLADSGVASKSLLRTKVYPDSDDLGAGDDGSDDVYDRVELGYNRQAQVRSILDQNETEHRFEYDGLGRLTDDRVTQLGAGIDGAVRRQSRRYDRTGRLERVNSWDHAEVGQGSAVNEVQLRYNGFGQLTREYQSHEGQVATGSTPSVQYAYADGTNRHIRRLSTIYPGDREIALSYGASGSADDKLGRVHEIQDANDGDQVLARYTRRGLSATMRIEYPETGPSNPLEMTYIKQAGESNGPAGDQYTGQDQFNRIIDIRWLRSGTTTHVDRIQYGFDWAGNRLWRKNVVAASNWDELYQYDGLYQLSDRQRGTLNSGNTGLTATALDHEDFTYDPAGNWDEYLTKASGTTTLDQARTHNKANEITAIDASSSLVSHDAAGNMTLFPKVGNWAQGQTATWDAWNRLVKVEEGSTILGEYSYDGFTRRVWQGFGDGPGGRIHYYYSDQWQVLEQRLGATDFADRTFVWGLRYADDLILRDHGTERLYATHDQWHVISTVAVNGSATERFAYRAFGETQVLEPNFTPRTSSISGWESTYGAYRYDIETGLYCVRFRYLHSGLGRWLSRDPLDLVEDKSLVAYVSNNVENLVDPLGLQASSGGGICNITIYTGHASGSGQCRDKLIEAYKRCRVRPQGCITHVEAAISCFPADIQLWFERFCPANTLEGLACELHSLTDEKGQMMMGPAPGAGGDMEKRAIEAAFEKAKEKAKDMCEQKGNCCKMVAIVIVPVDQGDKLAEYQKSRVWRDFYNAHSGRYDCKSKVVTPFGR